MGYYDDREIFQPQYHSDECVCDIVRNIVQEQDKVAEKDCSNYCDIISNQLPGKNDDSDSQKNTIPFILYCSGTCDPFVGSGVFQAPATENRDSFFGCIESPIFRAVQFVKNSDCCVRLELLLPVSNGCEVKPCHTKHVSKLAQFFPEGSPVTDFISTGVCLTVNLKEFVGITCLNPIKPIV